MGHGGLGRGPGLPGERDARRQEKASVRGDALLCGAGGAGDIRRPVEVEVVDGQGSFDVTVKGGGRKGVVVDPYDRFLARKVSVSRIKP